MDSQHESNGIKQEAHHQPDVCVEQINNEHYIPNINETDN